MGDFFAALAMSSPFWGLVFFVIIAGRWDKRHCPKIKFKDFKRFYELNPKRWRCDTDYVQCQIEREYDCEMFVFTFVDECKYRIWRRKCSKHKENQKRNKSIQRMLDAVKADIASAKAQETTDSIAAFKQLLKEIKDQKMTDELPSLAELLKKYGVE